LLATAIGLQVIASTRNAQKVDNLPAALVGEMGQTAKKVDGDVIQIFCVGNGLKAAPRMRIPSKRSQPTERAARSSHLIGIGNIHRQLL
jgi:hypothetical protein